MHFIFGVIYQSSNNTKYTFKIIYMRVYLKKLLKNNLKKVWLDYFHINLFERIDKFMANN